MPTYEYACTSCTHEWEFEQSIKDEPLKKCPKCRRSTARRQISRGAGFILKGSGWYSDLYSSSSNKAPGGAEKAASGGDKGGSGTEGGKADKGSTTASSEGASETKSSPAAETAASATKKKNKSPDAAA